jgi:hypothetical protein
MRIVSAFVVAMLVVGSRYAQAQDVGPQPPAQGEPPMAQPSSVQPTDVPPAPPQLVPSPPQPEVQASPQAAQAQGDGQWVYTQQYGWVWMPYGSQYTYEPTRSCPRSCGN